MNYVLDFINGDLPMEFENFGNLANWEFQLARLTVTQRQQLEKKRSTQNNMTPTKKKIS